MNKKMLAVLVGVIVVLNLAVITTGLLTRGGTHQDDQVPDLMSALGGLLGGLAPALPLTGLSCNSQSVANPFVLEGRRDRTVDCAVAIPADADAEYRRTELHLLSPVDGVFLKVDYRYDQSPRIDQDPNCLSKSQFERRLTRRGLFLEISYEPRKESSADGTCWLIQKPTEPLVLTVFADGATLGLSVTCRNCGSPTARFQLK